MRPSLSFTATILIAFTSVFSLGLGAAAIRFRHAGEEAAVATADIQLAGIATAAAARTNALVRPVVALAGLLAGGGRSWRASKPWTASRSRPY